MKRFYIQPLAIFEHTEADDLLVSTIMEDDTNLGESWSKESGFVFGDDSYAFDFTDDYQYEIPIIE